MNVTVFDEFPLRLNDSERPYFGLDTIDPAWDTRVLYSKTNAWQKRVTMFFSADCITKVIVEEIHLLDGEAKARRYEEYDTHVETKARKQILPLTVRGKSKPLTASNLADITPFGCIVQISMDEQQPTRMFARNLRNHQTLAIGEQQRIAAIQTEQDLHAFVKHYAATCPPDYFTRIERMRTAKHVTVRYRPGDIFRMEIDRFRYGYGIVTGEVRRIRKWPELPEPHTLRALMTVPVIVRYYDRITTDGTPTPAQLAHIPLTQPEICSDNDLIWGTHPIIGHKKLTADDLAFPLVCAKYRALDERFPVWTQNDFLSKPGQAGTPYNLYVEWGAAVVTLPYTQLTEPLRTLLRDYRTPYGGVATGITPSYLLAAAGERAPNWTQKQSLFAPHNQPLREALFACLGLPCNAGFDDFARKFGGLTREEILKRI